MKTFRRLRSVLALFALVSVLFSQLAVAAYACPGDTEMARAAVAGTSMPGCEKHPGPVERSALCVAHCQQGDQSSERVGVSAPAAAPCALPTAIVVVLAVPADPGEAAPQDSLLERPTGPPLPVRHCCLRI